MGNAEEGGSGPDKAGTCQHCQMVRVRRARREGVREEPAWDASLTGTGSNLVDMGRAAVRVTIVAVVASVPTEPIGRDRAGGKSAAYSRRPPGYSWAPDSLSGNR